MYGGAASRWKVVGCEAPGAQLEGAGVQRDPTARRLLLLLSLSHGLSTSSGSSSSPPRVAVTVITICPSHPRPGPQEMRAHPLPTHFATVPVPVCIRRYIRVDSLVRGCGQVLNANHRDSTALQSLYYAVTLGCRRWVIGHLFITWCTM